MILHGRVSTYSLVMVLMTSSSNHTIYFMIMLGSEGGGKDSRTRPARWGASKLWTCVWMPTTYTILSGYSRKLRERRTV